MGGTSTGVALVHGLAPRMSHDNQIGAWQIGAWQIGAWQIGAWPLKMPQIDIHTSGPA